MASLRERFKPRPASRLTLPALAPLEALPDQADGSVVHSAVATTFALGRRLAYAGTATAIRVSDSANFALVLAQPLASFLLSC
jgi:hypothetical protein